MITIRKAGLKDIPAVIRLWSGFREFHDTLTSERDLKLEPFENTDKNVSRASFRRFAEKTVKSRNGAVFLAVVDGKIAGFSLCVIRKETPVHRYKRTGSIDYMFIREEFRGKKLSSLLYQTAAEWMKGKGIYHISIVVSPENKRAYDIYRKWGFLDCYMVTRKKL
jgi:GNAT superfamily N-acetyltransferase